MKKVVSVVTAPFRAVGRLLKRLSGALGGLGKPFVKLHALRGRERVVAYGVIVIVGLGVVFALKPEPDASEQVRDTLERYERATRDKNYQSLCDELLSSELVDRIRAAGLPCEVALRTGLDSRQNPQLEVLGIEVNGDDALARVSGSAVGEVAATETFRLVREDGDWRIASAGEATP